MPSPAQDTLSTVVHQGQVRSRGSWYPPGRWNTVVLTEVQRSQALNHPATTSNRAIGGVYRTMSPWSKEWFRSHARPTSARMRENKSRDYLTTIWEGYVPVSLAPNTSHTGTFRDITSRWFPYSPLLQFGAENEARTRVLKKVGQKKWDLGVAAIELRQTAGLVTDLATGMVRTVENIVNSRHNARKQVDQLFREVRKEGDFYKAAQKIGLSDTKLLDSVKDRWMQYQFGVRPLLKDIDDATNYLADRVAQKVPFVIYAKAGAERSDTYMGARNCSADGVALMTIKPRIEESCLVHYSVQYEMPTGQVSDLTLLGLDNPWSTLWEGTRLSWMVDYAVGVGDWLQSFSAANGLVFRQGCKSVLRKLVAQEFILTGKNGWIVEERPRLNGILLERGDFKRELLSSGLTPPVVPVVKSTLGLTQLGNSLFALSNVLGGKPGLR